MLHNGHAGTAAGRCPCVLLTCAVGVALFWLPWPIGGLLCGVVALFVEIIKRRNDR